jgi:hypothetical protein
METPWVKAFFGVMFALTGLVMILVDVDEPKPSVLSLAASTAYTLGGLWMIHCRNKKGGA